MKRYATLFAGIAMLLIGTAQGAEKQAIPLKKFYGKAVSVNLNSNDLVVYNKKKKLESRFKLDPQAKIVLKKKTQPMTELKEGQSWIVYYEADQNKKVAKRITIRSKSSRKKKPTVN